MSTLSNDSRVQSDQSVTCTSGLALFSGVAVQVGGKYIIIALKFKLYGDIHKAKTLS